MKTKNVFLQLTLLCGMVVLNACDSTSAPSTSSPINIGAGSAPGVATSAPATPTSTNPGTAPGGAGNTGGSGSVISNAIPLAVPDVAVVQVNSTGNPINALANDTDANGDALTIAAASVSLSLPPAPNSTIALAPDRKTIRYTPPAGFIGTQTLAYTISDGRGGIASALAVITVSPLAVPPAAVPDVFTKLVNAPVSVLSVLTNDFDGAGGGLVVINASSVATLPAGNAGSAVVVNGALQYRPRAGFTGVETLSYTLRDANGATATAVVVVTISPLAAPPVALPDVTTLTVGSTATLNVLANDVDLAGGGLTLTAVTPLASLPSGSEGGFAIANNQVVYTPTSPTFVGTQSARYTVSDLNGSTATGLITLVIAPRPPSVPPLAIPDIATRSSGSTTAVLNVLSNDIDPAGRGLTVTAVAVLLGLPNSTGVSTTTDGSTVTLTLPATYAGVLTLSYTIRDFNGSTATGAAVVTVAPAPIPALPPVPVPDLATLAQGGAAVNINVLANDIDPAGGGLNLGAVSVLASLPMASHTLTTLNDQVQFTPALGFAGVVTIRYTARDLNLNTADGLLTITVTPKLLSAPPVALPDIAVVAQNGGASSIDVVTNDIDPAGNRLTLAGASVLVSMPTAAHTVTRLNNKVQFTPAPGFAGVVTVNYTATDSAGASTMGLLTITVTPTLPLLVPVALPDVVALATGSVAASINVLANDINPAGGALTLSDVSVLVSLPSAAHTMTNTPETLQFTPAPGFVGIVTLRYTATDINGGTNVGLVAITVTPALPVSLPSAVGDVGTLVVTLLGGNTGSFNVLANDIDPAGLGLQLQSVNFQNPLLATAGSVLDIVGNQVQLTTPLTGLISGVLPIGYTATDGLGRSITGLLNLTIAPGVPVALPAAVGDVGALVVTLLSGSTGNFNVLANDIDPAGGGLTLQSVSFQNPLLATFGSVLGIVGDQVQLTVPLTGLITGVLPIEYTAIDTLGRTVTGVLNVTLLP